MQSSNSRGSSNEPLRAPRDSDDRMIAGPPRGVRGRLRGTISVLVEPGVGHSAPPVVGEGEGLGAWQAGGGPDDPTLILRSMEEASCEIQAHCRC